MGQKMRDHDRHSSSQGYLNVTIKNGKLRSSGESKDLVKASLPKIKINKIQIGESPGVLNTQLQSERENQRSSERVKYT